MAITTPDYIKRFEDYGQQSVDAVQNSLTAKPEGPGWRAWAATALGTLAIAGAVAGFAKQEKDPATGPTPAPYSEKDIRGVTHFQAVTAEPGEGISNLVEKVNPESVSGPESTYAEKEALEAVVEDQTNGGIVQEGKAYAVPVLPGRQGETEQK